MSIIRRIPEGAPHSVGSKSLKRDRMKIARGSPEWYQRLVDYYLSRREPHAAMWDLVEARYLHDRRGIRGEDESFLSDEIRVGRVYSIVHTIESMVFSRRPKFFLEGWHGRITKEEVPALAAMLNNEWYVDYSLVREIKLCIRDCIKTGWGILLTSYDAEFDAKTQRDKAIAQAEEAVTNPLLFMAEATQGQMLPEGLQSQEYQETFQGDSRVIMDAINSRRIDPWMFLIDPDSTGPEDAKWMGRMVWADVEALQADETLDNRKELHPNATGTQTWRDLRSNKDIRNPYDLVLLYEIFERLPGGGWKMVLFAKDHGKFLKQVENPFWVGCPYKVLRWNDDGRSPFAQSDILPALSLIEAEEWMLTKVIDGYCREHMDTTFYDKMAGVSMEELKAAASPEVGKYVGVTMASGRALRDLILKLPKDVKSPEAMNLLSLVDRSILISVGLGPNQFGQALKSATSATESNEIATFARARGGHKYDGFEHFIAGSGSLRLGMSAQFYRDEDGKPDADRVRRIAGDEAADVWKKTRWTPADVRQGLRVRVEPGSMRPIDDDTKASQMIQWASIAGQIPQLAQITDWNEFAIQLYRKMGFQDSQGLIFGLQQMALMAAMQTIGQTAMNGGAAGAQIVPQGAGAGGAPPSGQAGMMQELLGARNGGMAL